jgi:hypothetical protein
LPFDVNVNCSLGQIHPGKGICRLLIPYYVDRELVFSKIF